MDHDIVSTGQAGRDQPPTQLRDRPTPAAVGIVLGLLISVLVVVVVAVQS